MEQEKNVTPEQIRAGRAIRGLSQAALAEAAGVSSMTVKRAEGIGRPYPSDTAISAIRTALEAAGVVFLDPNGNGPGVALKRDSDDS